MAELQQGQTFQRSHGEEEEAAAAVVASLSTACGSAIGKGWKRTEREDEEEEEEEDSRPVKSARRMEPKPSKPEPPVPMEVVDIRVPGPPFFHYRDFSRQQDDDPLTPLTPPARVPNFPAKLHAILSRPDLADVVAWMPHGRSWRVLKPREFEVRVIPTYFEHAKFSSFIRQANGWGFRRITQGRDRNSYYHELFLRGLPHLCKQMKRPGVAEKTTADPDHEPDFYQISQLHPVPEKACDDDGILLPCTLKDGPKARMPVHYGVLTPTAASTAQTSVATTAPASATPRMTPVASAVPMMQPLTLTSAVPLAPPVTLSAPPPLAAAAAATTAAATTVDPTKFGMNPRDLESLGSFQHALQSTHGQVTLNQPQTPPSVAPAPADWSAVVSNLSPLFCASLTASRQAAAVHQAAMSFCVPPSTTAATAPPQDAAYAASQFAAGFAAATALSSDRIRCVLENALQVSSTPRTTSAATSAKQS